MGKVKIGYCVAQGVCFQDATPTRAPQQGRERRAALPAPTPRAAPAPAAPMTFQVRCSVYSQPWCHAASNVAGEQCWCCAVHLGSPAPWEAQWSTMPVTQKAALGGWNSCDTLAPVPCAQDFLREVDLQFLDHMRRGTSINFADLASDPPPATLKVGLLHLHV